MPTELAGIKGESSPGSPSVSRQCNSLARSLPSQFSPLPPCTRHQASRPALPSAGAGSKPRVTASSIPRLVACSSSMSVRRSFSGRSSATTVVPALSFAWMVSCTNVPATIADTSPLSPLPNVLNVLNRTYTRIVRWSLCNSIYKAALRL
ncbi:hypothetical protein B0H19DRAFT_1129154 [Mycena capillaripes]|nr:hypothetical protein B0H19DRAFT_1129154 [Mycena capillaripes]